jgi:hypothetical protein
MCGEFGVVLEIYQYVKANYWYYLVLILLIALYQVFEVAPSLFMVDVGRLEGDTLEYNRFCSLILHTN